MGEKCIKNSSLGKSLEFLLCSEGSGRLTGVFHQAWYVDFDGVIAMLCEDSFGYISFCTGFEDFSDSFVYNKQLENSEVKYKNGLLDIPAAGLTIELHRGGNPGFDVNKSTADSILLTEALRKSGKGYLKDIITGGKPENPFFKRSKQLVGEFTDAFAKKDETSGKTLLKAMLGLGPGLTPSMDDWICGFFYCMQRSETYAQYCRRLGSYVLKVGRECTNSISFAFLRSVITEDCFELLDRALYAGETEKLLSVGSSSGSDMLCGMISALETIKTTENRGNINEV